MKVIRSCGVANTKNSDTAEQQRMLEASWDYWERKGLAHPMKRDINGVKPIELPGASKDES